ncbi:MAG: polysaccharide pyruvyl transferase CsaB [Vampirovibrionales bacterium]|nr:polysaccharide pyruvyl transferase CsaB [Vampirovibrionales bacterium]
MSIAAAPSVDASRAQACRVVVSGYYGFDNLGDELILQALLAHLRARGYHVTVLSAKPEQTARRYQVEAISRLDLAAIIPAIARCHLLISGGGGLFQDATGPASPIYYGGLILLAAYFKIPVLLWAQGVGPLKTWLGRQMSALAMRRCRHFLVRDAFSAALIGDLTGREAEVTADPVWTLQLPPRAKARAQDVWQIGVSLRPWPDLTPERIRELAAFFRRLTDGAEKPVQFHLTPFQPQADLDPLHAFADALQAEGLRNIHWVSVNALLETIPQFHLMFGMRYHSLVLAMLSHVPVYGLVYDPKVSQLLEGFHLQGVSIAQIAHMDVDAIRAYFVRYQEPDLSALQRSAAINFQRLDELLAYEMEEGEMVMDDIVI